MVNNWKPDIKRTRVPGPSVRTLAVWGLAAAVAFFVLMSIFVIGLAIRGSGYQGSPFLTAVIVLIGVFGIFAAVCNIIISYWVGPAELRSRYTTERGDHEKVCQVDPRTNRVVRLAGEPFLDPDEYQRRIRLIRESAGREDRRLRAHGVGSSSNSLVDPGTQEGLVAVIRDAMGTPLADGDSVVIIRDLKFNGAAAVVEAGTEVHGISLAYDRADDRVIGARAKGVGWLHLRSRSVKKL